jgi:hypothetical protein
MEVRNYLDQSLPRPWIGRPTDQNMALTRWPRRNPDLRFFLVEIYQRQRFVPPLPVSVNDLKQSNTTALASVDEDMLRCVWNELDYYLSCDKSSHNRTFVT